MDLIFKNIIYKKILFDHYDHSQRAVYVTKGWEKEKIFHEQKANE